MSQRIAVIGAGVVGLATAGRLAERGHRVTLIEVAAVGSGTSERLLVQALEVGEPSLEIFRPRRFGVAGARRPRAGTPPSPG